MAAKPTLVLDVEVYRDYFLLGFLNVDTGATRAFEMFAGYPLDSDTIRKILEIYRVVSFNGNHYDLPMISAALKGATCAQIKALSDKIIVNNIKHWNLGIELVRCDHIDIFEVAPGMASLKIYGGRLHCPKLQDLPIQPDASISPADREDLKTYNVNDLRTTLALFNHLKPQIELREQMSKVYGIDLRSKSDAQIAEAVIVKEVETATGDKMRRPEVPSGTRFPYEPPGFIAFTTPDLQALLQVVKGLSFLVTDGGTVQMPDELAKAVTRIGNSAYKIGIGGLHSQEKTVSYYTNETHILLDQDVASYYPAIILNNNVSPPHMGMHFTKSFSSKKDQRIVAKKAGDKTVSDALKIVLNGAGGKLNSKWSKLYFPQGFIHMTLTGQLAILMLIERLEQAGVAVVSANTDGIAIHCPRTLSATMEAIIAQWEKDTRFDMERTDYRSLHKHSVNSYIGLKTDGKFTLKGEYVMEELCVSKDRGIATNPSNLICVEAVARFLRDRTPIEETITGCADLKKFVTIRQVKGGAIDQGEITLIDDWQEYEGGSWIRKAWVELGLPYDRMATGPNKPEPVTIVGPGRYLGKAVRWYYAKNVQGPLRYKVNNYTVARSEGAKACLDLPETMPTDIDLDWYIAESRAILADIGVDPVLYQVEDLV